SGGTNINGGTLSVASDSALGTGPVTIGPAGTLNYTAGATTTKSYALGGGTLSIAAGQTLTFNGSSVSNGYLGGAGTFATGAAGARFANVTTQPSVTVASNSSADQFINFTNGGTLSVAAGLATPVTFNGFTNGGPGTATVGAGSQGNAANCQPDR